DESVDGVRHVLRVLRRPRRQQARESQRTKENQADVINVPSANSTKTISREEHTIGATGQAHLCRELRKGGQCTPGNDLAEHGLAAHTRTRWHRARTRCKFRMPKGELINAASRQRDRLLDSSRNVRYDKCTVTSAVREVHHQRVAAENPWRAGRGELHA